MEHSLPQNPATYLRGESLVGKRIGRWFVESQAPSCGYVHYYNCVCSCGKSREVLRSALMNGTSKSCGCLRTEILTKKFTTHGGSHHPLWKTYHSMLTRCRNPNYREFHLYGGRGIQVCQRWCDSFAFFLEDMGEKPYEDYQLDRIDNNGNYCKENCRWVSKEDNARNKRNTVYVDFHGEQKPLKEVAEILNLAYSALFYRYQKGETGERLFRPSQAH